MNYRLWLLYRAQQYEDEVSEPEILRYSTWQNYQAVRDWIGRLHAAPLPSLVRNEQLAGPSLS